MNSLWVLFGAIFSGSLVLPLALHLGSLLVGLRKPYTMSGIESGSAMCNPNDFLEFLCSGSMSSFSKINLCKGIRNVIIKCNSQFKTQTMYSYDALYTMN